MILYHGSKDTSIEVFDLEHSRDSLDFGSGVYLTTILKQAKQRAGKGGAVYKFDVDFSDLNVVEYKDEDLNYVLYLCRIELEDVARETIDDFDDADIVMGQVLGRVKRFKRRSERFNCGDIQYDEFSKRIKLFDDKDQICFKTQKAVDLLNKSFIGKV